MFVKGNQQERGNAQYLPPDEQGFQISGKHSHIIAEVEEKDGVEKTLVARFAVQIIAAVNGHQKCKQCSDYQIDGSDLIKIEINEKIIVVGLIKSKVVVIKNGKAVKQPINDKQYD